MRLRFPSEKVLEPEAVRVAQSHRCPGRCQIVHVEVIKMASLCFVHSSTMKKEKKAMYIHFEPRKREKNQTDPKQQDCSWKASRGTKKGCTQS